MAAWNSFGGLDMASSTKLDEIRRSALAGVEESRRLWARVITLFAVVEGLCWIAYILLAYFQFPTSVLIGVAALLVYSTVFTTIMGLRLHFDKGTQRILKAIETLVPEEGGQMTKAE
jgi:hypothetical protein